jgi:hypothetical protein
MVVLLLVIIFPLDQQPPNSSEDHFLKWLYSATPKTKEGPKTSPKEPGFASEMG